MQQPYWTVSEGTAVRRWSCSECRKDIPKGSSVVMRDGRKIRLAYHPACFSGNADPRSQQGSSFHTNRLPKTSFQQQAPAIKGRGKWSVASYGYQPSMSLPNLASLAVTRPSVAADSAVDVGVRGGASRRPSVLTPRDHPALQPQALGPLQERRSTSVGRKQPASVSSAAASAATPPASASGVRRPALGPPSRLPVAGGAEGKRQ